jgi:tRNA(Arg) A34 adenosine deaminase TadA
MLPNYPTITVPPPDWLAALAPPDAVVPAAEDRMRLVVRLAAANVDRRAGGPFAAAVFEADTGRLVAAGVNSVVRLGNSVLHAEVLALMTAQARVGSFTLAAPGLPVHELVASCDPCAMCLGAVLWAGVRRLVCGADREDAEAAGFDEGPVFPASYAYLAGKGVAVVRGVCRDEARSVFPRYRAAGGPVYNP